MGGAWAADAADTVHLMLPPNVSRPPPLHDPHTQAKTIIFVSTCKQVRFLFEAFRKLRPGVPLRALHGKMAQIKRMGGEQRVELCACAGLQCCCGAGQLHGRWQLVQRTPGGLSSRGIYILGALHRAPPPAAVPWRAICATDQSRFYCMPCCAVFYEFCEAKAMVLFATDIAARGLDFPTVDWVVQVNRRRGGQLCCCWWPSMKASMWPLVACMKASLRPRLPGHRLSLR